MKKYISEIFLTTDNVKEKSWLELIYAISSFNKLFHTWNFYIKIELNKVHYYVETNCVLPTIINSLSDFLIKKIDEEELNFPEEYRTSIPYIITSNQKCVLDLYDKNEVKYNRKLIWSKIKIFPYKKDNYFSTTHLFFEKANGKLICKKAFFNTPYKFQSIDFSSRNRFFYSKEASKYLNIQKSLHIFDDKEEKAFLKVDAFPYFAGDNYLSLSNYDFDRHSIIIGASGTGKSKLISSLISNLNENFNEKYKIVVIDPHASLENDVGGLDSCRVLDFNTLENSIDLFINEDTNMVASTELTLELFKNLFQDQYNSKLERVLRHSISLLLEKNMLNFNTLRRVILDLSFRNKLIESEGIQDNVKAFFLNDFNELKNKSYQEAISPILSFIDEMEALPAFRYQGNMQNLKECINDNFVTIFSLNQVTLGEKITKTIAGLVMRQMMQLIQAYSFDEHIIFVIDEVSVVESPILSRFLSEARKYNLSLILAQQYFNQISKELQSSIFANVINYYVFRLSKMDASTLSPTLQMELPADSSYLKTKFLSELKNRECILRISSNGEILHAFKAKTMDFIPIPKMVRNQILNIYPIFAKKELILNKEENMGESKFKFDVNKNINLKELMLSQSSSRKKVANNG